MRILVPPIKSQGIKTKLVPWIQALVPAVKGRWIEPFLGTGVVAFNSGFRRALLGDINPHIIGFYQAVSDGRITPTSVRVFLEREGKLLESAAEQGMRISEWSEIVSTSSLTLWTFYFCHEQF